jgi:outer membrane lipoprotein-sorting protein
MLMRTSRLTGPLLFALAALLLTGCPRRIPEPDDAIEKPEVLRRAIDARLEPVESARFKEVVLDYFGEKDRVKLRQLILVERPDRLRVQTRIPGTDGIMSLLVSNGETFSLHRRDTGVYYTGAPTPENINRLLPVDLSARDVTRVLLGGAPWDRFADEPGSPRLEWNDRSGQYRYSVVTDEGGELFMEVRPSDFAVVEVREIDARGAQIYSYTTDDWERADDELALPEYRRFVWPARKLDFSLEVGETQIDVDLPDLLFTFAPPPGSKIIEVD